MQLIAFSDSCGGSESVSRSWEALHYDSGQVLSWHCSDAVDSAFSCPFTVRPLLTLWLLQAVLCVGPTEPSWNLSPPEALV